MRALAIILCLWINWFCTHAVLVNALWHVVLVDEDQVEMEKDQERCQFIIPRKSRTCRMLVKSGQKYCGEHAGEERDRIRCPLDPHHTVNRSDLDSHVTKCNSRLNTDLPFIEPGINDVKEESSPTTSKFSLSQVTDVELKNTIDKLEAAYSQLRIEVENAFLEHECMKKELSLESHGVDARRHLQQQSSILAIADRLGMMDIGKRKSICYVEFGAGRARLTYWLAKCIQEKLNEVQGPTPSKVSYVLVERSGQRYKFENKLTDLSSFSFQRIRCSIENIDLRRVECIQNSDYCVSFCKHLCGSGMDAAIRCISNTTDPNGDPSRSPNGDPNRSPNGDPSPIGLMSSFMAPCCHHRCEWRTFVGREWLSELGFTNREFQILTAMTSWATCGLVGVDNTGIDRRAIGRKCILVLNRARAKYLEKTGRFDVSLYYYVPQDTTPENLLLVVTPTDRS